MITGTHADKPTAADQAKGIAAGMTLIAILLAMQFSAALKMLSALETYLSANTEVLPSELANSVLSNMASLMITAVVIFAAVFIAAYLGKGLVAGLVTGVAGYVCYVGTHLAIWGKMSPYKDLLTVAFPGKVISDGLLLVVVPAAAGAYLGTWVVAKRAREARAKVQAHQAAIEMEKRMKKAREGTQTAEVVGIRSAPQAATPAAAPQNPSPARTAAPAALAAASSIPHLVCHKCGTANSPHRNACFMCGAVLESV